MITPTTIHADGAIDVMHTDHGYGCTGRIPADQVMFGRRQDGTWDYGVLVLDCPGGCGSQSTHPIKSGGDQEMLQRLAAHVLMRTEEDVPGLGPHPGRGKQRELAEVKRRLRELCGDGYRLSGVQDVTGRPVKESERVAASEALENEPLPLSPVSPPSRRQDLAETIAAAIRKNPDAARIIADALERA